jgi:hypothetical protein
MLAAVRIPGVVDVEFSAGSTNHVIRPDELSFVADALNTASVGRPGGLAGLPAARE